MVNWGIIGCGNVAEKKSGPAFYNVQNSELAMVMSRDILNAKDFAVRHNVKNFTNDGYEVINSSSVNAIYIATPPLFHHHWCLEAIKAGKPVYVEKPMALNYFQALEMASVAGNANIPLCVAHYRRFQPMFMYIQELLSSDAIGRVTEVDLKILRKPLTPDDLHVAAKRWRVDPRISGGGLFFDLAPHQLDLMLLWFGEYIDVKSINRKYTECYDAIDHTEAIIYFSNGVKFTGLWNFHAQEDEKDECVITGSGGKIIFSFFRGNVVKLLTDGKTVTNTFDTPAIAQLGLITEVVSFFSDRGVNPCSGIEGAKVMKLMHDIYAI